MADLADAANPATIGRVTFLVMVEPKAGGDCKHIALFRVGAVPVHDDGNAGQKCAEAELQLLSVEIVCDVGAKESTGQRGDGKGDGGFEIYPSLPEVSGGSRYGIDHDDEQAGADDGRCRVEVRPYAAVGQKEDEDRHADEAAADAKQGAEHPRSDAQEQKQNKFHVKEPALLI